MMTRFLLGLMLASASVTAMGQYAAPPATSSVGMDSQQAFDTVLLQSLLHQPYPAVLLRADDTVAVKLLGVSDYDFKVRVNANGTVQLPLVGEVPAAGSTVEQLQDAIRNKLRSSGQVLDPQLSVSIATQPSAVVTVSGQVSKPGLFPGLGQLTIIDYLSLAGGIGGERGPASPMITLIRPSLAAPVAVPLGADPQTSPYARIPVFAGDEIRVGATGLIYAVGAFKNQGAFALKGFGPTTVSDVVALAGGIGYEADYGDAHIVRATSSGRVLIHINIQKILKGQTSDISLQRDDILFVPTSAMKAAIKGGGAGIIAGFATSYVYRF